MIYDRPYMREDFSPRQVPILKWILLSTIAVFVLQNIFGLWFQQTPALSLFFTRFFALSPEALSSGFIWTIVSYAFLHGSVLHILGNMLLVFFIGRELVPILGARRFGQLYFSAAAVGGLAWLVVRILIGGGPLVGASAAGLALLTVFACLYPNKPITLLLYFIIPITIKPKYLAYIAVGVSLFGLFFFELPGATGSQTAHSAHLGGILTGWLFFRYVLSQPAKASPRPSVELPNWFKKSRPSKADKFSVNIVNRKVLQEEVDRILDKINSRGFGALSEEEKKILDRARDLLSK